MRRPWNVINVPIYSLATFHLGRVNMNVCSYVMPVSRKPKLYAVALEHETFTLKNTIETDFAILQLLTKSQMSLVKTLGKKSGYSYDKSAFLKRKDMLTLWKNNTVLDQCAAYLYLKKQNQISCGDHELFLFEVSHSKSLTDQNILMWQDLIEARIIL